MTSFSDISNTLRAFYEGRHEPENMKPLAEWYWRTMLTAAIFGIAGILAFGTWEFVSVLRILSAGDSLQRSAPPEILSKKALADLLEAYRERQDNFESLKRSVSSISDPSR